VSYWRRATRLLLLIEQYKSLGKKTGAALFCNEFINMIKKKFYCELNSHIYAIAAIFNVSMLHLWARKPFGKDYVKKAFDSILNYSDLIEETENLSNTSSNKSSSNSQHKSFDNNNTDLDADLLLLFDKIIENHEDENPVVSNLEKEILKTMLNEKTFLTITSIKFWLENKKHFQT
jgi:hypothetical protein